MTHSVRFSPLHLNRKPRSQERDGQRAQGRPSSGRVNPTMVPIPGPGHWTPDYDKAFFDYVKYLTTLSTGAILLQVAFLEKVFSHPRWKVLIALSLSSFTLTVIASVACYTMGLAKTRGRMGYRDAPLYCALGLALFGFLIGVASLTVFALKNLFTL
jgi:hypothetical protein